MNTVKVAHTHITKAEGNVSTTATYCNRLDAALHFFTHLQKGSHTETVETAPENGKEVEILQCIQN